MVQELFFFPAPFWGWRFSSTSFLIFFLFFFFLLSFVLPSFVNIFLFHQNPEVFCLHSADFLCELFPM